MPMARRMPWAENASRARSAARRPRNLPGNGIAIAELGQHTASGIVLIGVAQAPAMPLSSLTPVKKSPTTTLSIAIRSSSEPRTAPIAAIVSSRIEELAGGIGRIRSFVCPETRYVIAPGYCHPRESGGPEAGAVTPEPCPRAMLRRSAGVEPGGAFAGMTTKLLKFIGLFPDRHLG